VLSERINNNYTEIMLEIHRITHETENCLSSPNLRVLLPKLKKNHQNYEENQLKDCFGFGGAISKF
jgi:hypothetical protein